MADPKTGSAEQEPAEGARAGDDDLQVEEPAPIPARDPKVPDRRRRLRKRLSM